MTPNRTAESVMLDHIRSQGCRDLLVYCEALDCSHSADLYAFDLMELNGIFARSLWSDGRSDLRSYLLGRVLIIAVFMRRVSPIGRHAGF
jgi:hypothetical protein